MFTNPPAVFAVGPLLAGHATCKQEPEKNGLTEVMVIGDVTPLKPALHEQPLTTFVPALLGTDKQGTGVHAPLHDDEKTEKNNNELPEYPLLHVQVGEPFAFAGQPTRSQSSSS